MTIQNINIKFKTKKQNCILILYKCSNENSDYKMTNDKLEHSRTSQFCLTYDIKIN